MWGYRLLQGPCPRGTAAVASPGAAAAGAPRGGTAAARPAAAAASGSAAASRACAVATARGTAGVARLGVGWCSPAKHEVLLTAAARAAVLQLRGRRLHPGVARLAAQLKPTADMRNCDEARPVSTQASEPTGNRARLAGVARETDLVSEDAAAVVAKDCEPIPQHPPAWPPAAVKSRQAEGLSHSWQDPAWCQACTA